MEQITFPNYTLIENSMTKDMYELSNPAKGEAKPPLMEVPQDNFGFWFELQIRRRFKMRTKNGEIRSTHSSKLSPPITEKLLVDMRQVISPSVFLHTRLAETFFEMGFDVSGEIIEEICEFAKETVNQPPHNSAVVVKLTIREVYLENEITLAPIIGDYHQLEKIEFNGLNSMKCCICYDEFEEGSQLMKMACGHMFHGDCINIWLGESKSCPVCRHEMDVYN